VTSVVSDFILVRCGSNLDQVSAPRKLFLGLITGDFPGILFCDAVTFEFEVLKLLGEKIYVCLIHSNPIHVTAVFQGCFVVEH